MKKLVLSLLLTVGVGTLAGMLTSGEASGDWFRSLDKPSWQPPSAVFAPVWTVLYILMGISLYRVWRTPLSRERNMAITFFLAQLMFNFLWSVLFFNWHFIGFAFIDIVLLWLTLALTIFSFRKISVTAAWLLAPYIAWVSFATALNWEIWRLN
ncbi:MAG TPA: TspO/MBR family protein [Chitinophagaceae bacterium]